jgi:hypothetical protein
MRPIGVAAIDGRRLAIVSAVIKIIHRPVAAAVGNPGAIDRRPNAQLGGNIRPALIRHRRSGKSHRGRGQNRGGDQSQCVSHLQTFCNKGFAIGDCRPQAPSCRAQSYEPLTRRWLLGQSKKINTFSEIALNQDRATASVKALLAVSPPQLPRSHRNSAAQSIGTEFGNCQFRLTKLYRFVCIGRPPVWRPLFIPGTRCVGDLGCRVSPSC